MQSMLNITVCADGWNLSWVFEFFTLIFATFNAATGRAAREAQLYLFGHRITKEWGAGPCSKPTVVRRRMCGNWDFVTTAVVLGLLSGMCVMNDYNVSWVPKQRKTLTWYARVKYICLHVLVIFRHVGWFALYPVDNTPLVGKLITAFPVFVLAEAENHQSSMDSDDDSQDPEKERFL